MDLFRLSRTYRSARRLQQIINVLLKHGFGRVIDQIHLGRYIPFRKRLRAFGQWPTLKGPSVPERLRIAFGELGPSFIKLAQILFDEGADSAAVADHTETDHRLYRLPSSSIAR